ncbi:FKBP-type peptidyl-prolyl cis-trans isomerase domain-containing protein [Tanacetum coccineum]
MVVVEDVDFVVANEDDKYSYSVLPYDQAFGDKPDNMFFRAITTVKHYGHGSGPGATKIGKPVVHPATADLRGKVYNLLRHNATRFLIDDVYRNPGCFCPALSRAVKTMNKGEKCLLMMKPKYAFMDNGSEPASGNDCIVPSNATIQITLELVSWKIVSELTTDNKVLKNILNEEVLRWTS